jgi:cell division protein FtsW
MKIMYLPEAHTDFIFSIIGEEFGFIGATVVIGLFLFLFLRGIKIAKNAPDDFARYLALGITVLITIQASMHIGVALGLLPNKGLALPFISAGGTSLVANMAAAGILVNLSQYSRRRKNAY